MKKSIIIGSVLAVFLILMIPTISAVEYQTIYDINESIIFKKINNIDNITIQDCLKLIQKIDREELKEIILEEINDLTIFHQWKSSIDQVMDSESFIEILLTGIIFPVIILTISTMIYDLWTNPLSFIITVFIGSFCMALFTLSAGELIAEETDLSSSEVMGMLIFIDTLIALLISGALIDNTT